MDKKFADEMIVQFQKKFFGFALGKCRSTEEAEELAARITCEAYVTMRSVDEVYNWEGYLYRIASNVYARYAREQANHRADDISELELDSGEDFGADYVKKEELELLKREVAWLGKRHREIVLLHYYHNKKISEIAKILELPEGTVKWHLSDAKNQLKEGMKTMRTEGSLGVEPIRLINMGSMGTPGTLGDTSFFLNSKLRQNIVYSAYFEPKTIKEIAAELGVSPVYVEDEVEYLEEYGFLDLMPGQKYRTNILIRGVPYDVVLQLKELDREIAVLYCDEYVPLLINRFRNYKRHGIYVPDDDLNYLLWSMIPMAVKDVDAKAFDWNTLRRRHYMVKRKDGGDYAAVADLYQRDVESLMTAHWEINGPSIAGEPEHNVMSWSLATDFDDRVFHAKDNHSADYDMLKMFVAGELPKIDALIDKYARLYDRGLLVNRNGQDQVNVVMIKQVIRPDSLESMWDIFPEMPEGLDEKIQEIGRRKFLIEKEYYPAHMHDMLKIYQTIRAVDRIQVLDELLRRGVLHTLPEHQRKGVMVVVFSDQLPE